MSLKRRVSEPVKLYWAIGIAASIALHASGVAGAILLVEDHVRNAAPTVSPMVSRWRPNCARSSTSLPPTSASSRWHSANSRRKSGFSRGCLSCRRALSHNPVFCASSEGANK